MTVGQLLSVISSRELTEWQIYEQEVGPLGGERLDYLFARMAATFVRVNVAAADQNKIKDSDFLIKWRGGGDPDGNDS